MTLEQMEALHDDVAAYRNLNLQIGYIERELKGREEPYQLSVSVNNQYLIYGTMMPSTELDAAYLQFLARVLVSYKKVAARQRIALSAKLAEL